MVIKFVEYMNHEEKETFQGSMFQLQHRAVQ